MIAPFWKHIFSTFLILFGILDIVGNLPIVIDLEKKYGRINAWQTTLVATGIMLLVLFLGERVITFFGTDVVSFAIAGSVILFLLSLQMLFGMEFSHSNHEEKTPCFSIVPVAFPLIAGAGSITTIITLTSTYTAPEIACGIFLNAIIIFFALRFSVTLGDLIGKNGIEILRRVFGIILLSIAISIFRKAVGF